MAANTRNVDSGQLGGALVDLFSGVDIDTKLVLAQPGGYVGMRYRVYVRIDANGNRGAPTHACGDLRDEFNFKLRFAIEAADTAFQRIANLARGLAYP